jgi:hypothetical protein
MNSPAWQELSVGAKATLLELTSNYNTMAKNAVFLPGRRGTKRLGVGSRNSINKWLRELEYYGFIAVVQKHHLGVDGEAWATRYRLTDRPYADQGPTHDFLNWDGVPFPEYKPRQKRRRPMLVSISVASGLN